MSNGATKQLLLAGSRQNYIFRHLSAPQLCEFNRYPYVALYEAPTLFRTDFKQPIMMGKKYRQYFVCTWSICELPVTFCMSYLLICSLFLWRTKFSSVASRHTMAFPSHLTRGLRVHRSNSDDGHNEIEIDSLHHAVHPWGACQP